jgi:diguanylate cyclase (GGDEF)-like protein/PAS domain S-box-containing protein
VVVGSGRTAPLSDAGRCGPLAEAARGLPAPGGLAAESELIRQLRTFPIAAAVLVAVSGLLVLVGWAFDLEVLKRVLPNWVAMNPLTALAFIGIAGSLALLARPESDSGPRRLARAVALAVALVGLARLATHLTGWDVGLDQWLFSARLRDGVSTGPNRMAPNTAVVFTLIGLALALLDWEPSPPRRPAQYLIVAAALIALLAVIGYAYQVAPFYEVPRFIPMAFPTALAFILVSIGALCARPDRGLMAVITSDGAGGRMARRLLPAAVLVPLLLGALSLAGERAGYYESVSGTCLVVISSIVAFTMLIYDNARLLHRTDTQRMRAEDALRQAHGALEERVHERTAELAEAHEVLQQAFDERSHVAAELRRSEGELRALFDITAVGMAQTDTDGRYIRVNRKFSEITGYPAEELLGRFFSEITHPEDRERDYGTFRQLIDGAVGQYLSEKRYVRRDGTEIWVNVSAALLRDEAGAPLRLVAVIEDITARRQAEQAIRELNARLACRLERIGGLRQIDLAIIAGQDLRLTLNTVLEQVRGQLDVDAADVLLLDPHGDVLTYAAGCGFREQGVSRTRVQVGQGSAGKSALERRIYRIPDLVADPGIFTRRPLVQSEGFVAYFAVPLVAKGHLHGVLEVFHRGPLDPDSEWLDFLDALAGQAAIAAENAHLLQALEQSNRELATSYDATIEGWARALDLRDRETEGHSRRVTEMTVHLARIMGIAAADLVHVRRGALLHDIGKMGIPDCILLKPGPLSDEEWEVMKRHPGYAYEWLSSIAFLRPALEIPYCHHEKWDGTGYPRGLVGEQIPLEARIFAAVDIWDALGHDRPYRKAWSQAEVETHLRSLAGTHLDPYVVEVFLRTLEAQRTVAPAPLRHHEPIAEQVPAPKPPLQLTPLQIPGRLANGPARPRGMRTLIVDDDASSARVLKRTLESLGHEVLVATDGNEAWAIIERGPVELVVSDWVMPGLDGLHLCRRIRSLSGRPYTYVVLVTGKGSGEDRLLALDAGADDFLMKPIEGREILARVKIAGRMIAIQDELLNRSHQVERMYAELRSQNERLAELAATDDLTGVQNRRKFHEALEGHLSFASRHELPLSVVIMDVDGFKPYNDEHGHLAGDEVLRVIARILRTSVRGHDIVSRYGGEEFAILLPATDAGAGRILAERLRAAIECHHWPLRRLTASFGIATTPPVPGQATALVGAADMALYHAKGHGRNRVTHHDDLVASAVVPA